MKIKQFLSILLIIFLTAALISSPATVQAADSDTYSLPELPEVKSRYVCVMDADSGEVLYQKGADEKCYPASTTKLLTSLLTIENCSLTETVTFSKAAVDSISYGDANAAILEGEQLTVEQALYCLILRSANEVAYGLSEHVAGSVTNFATMMNNKVKELGCANTHFTNPSGLHDEFHYTTPYDMALIAKACFDNKSLMKIMAYDEVYTIPPTNMRKFTRYYAHRYMMLKNGDYPYRYSLGGKTGFTDEAGSCLVSFAQKDDLRLICVIMNSTDEQRYEDTIALFDYYFDNFKKIYIADYDYGLTFDNVDILKLTDEIDSSSTIAVEFSENAYLLVPNEVSFNALTQLATYADNPAYVGKAGGFACISYYYKNVGMGTQTVFLKDLTTGGVIPGSNGVLDASYKVTPNETTSVVYVNLWYIVAAAGALLLVIIAIIVLVKYKKNHQRGGYRKTKLRF